LEWTLTGRHTDLRLVDENAFNPIHPNNELNSIEIDENDLQPLKQEESRISTVRGMTMKERDEREDVPVSIRRKNQSDSIETDESDSQPLK
jgi:hypothetical protein